MKILVADAFPKDRIADLARLPRIRAVEHRPELSAKELPAAARDASILVVRSKQVTGEVFEVLIGVATVVLAFILISTSPPEVLFIIFVVYGLSGYGDVLWRLLRRKKTPDAPRTLQGEGK